MARADLIPQPVPVVVVDEAGEDAPLFTAATISSLSSYTFALRLSAFSHAMAADVPRSCAIEVTSGWKSVSPGAIATLPFHLGEARSSSELGSAAGLILPVL